MREAIERAYLNNQRRRAELDDFVSRSQGSQSSRIGANLAGIFKRRQLNKELAGLQPQMDELNRQRSSSLAQAIGQVGGVNVNPENFNTEDLQKLRFLQLQKQIAPTATTAAPSAVREFQFVEKLNPEQRQQYINLKRSDPLRAKGLVETAEGGVEPIQGVESGLSRVEGAKERGKLEAQLDLEPSVTLANEAAKVVGKEQGISKAELDDRISSFPRMLELVDELSALGKKATYTKAGQASDSLRRQLGLSVGESGVARTEYVSKIDNEILPLLRQTFGAQFTENEGKSLRATLGDVDKSPQEKDAVLRSFIASKIGAIESLSKKTGEAVPSEIKFLGFE